MLSEDLYTQKNLCSWDDLYKCYEKLAITGKQWIFRGLKKSDYKLRSTLERSIIEFGDVNEDNDIEVCRVLKAGLKEGNVQSLEKRLIKEFQRRCYHYLDNSPDEENILEWLALMRHYEAPTRLLDWTYSFFVALYFAIEDVKDDCAVWALNTSWMQGKVRKILGDDLWTIFKDDENIRKRSTFETLFGRKKPVVIAINPFRLNERLVSQQGIFLCQSDVSKPFEENLEALLGGSQDKKNLIKYTIKVDTESKIEILSHLKRMNISLASLQPDLVGFSKSLKSLLVFPSSIAT